MNVGIYCILNKFNGDTYYGKSINISKRKYEHFRTLNKDTHKNVHLQNAFNKYGAENFIFKIILYCEPFELSRYEEYFIKIDNSYNICKESSVGTSGIKYTKEQKKKLSKINSGIGNPMYNKRHSNKTKYIMSRLAYGNKNPAKLTWENIYEIRKIYKEGENIDNMRYSWNTIQELSKKFNVGKTAIYNIVSCKSWKEGANHSCRSIGQNGGIQ